MHGVKWIFVTSLTNHDKIEQARKQRAQLLTNFAGVKNKKLQSELQLRSKVTEQQQKNILF